MELQHGPRHGNVPFTKFTSGASVSAMANSLEELVALAIKDADRSLFNENYTKQARSVLSALKKAGYEVVPRKPPDGLVEWAKDNIPFGRLRPTDLISQMYTMMVENVRKYEK